MLDYLGIKDLTELMESALPEATHYRGLSSLPVAISEDEALDRLHGIDSKNRITQTLYLRHN